MARFWAYCSEFDRISPYGRILSVTAGWRGLLPEQLEL